MVGEYLLQTDTGKLAELRVDEANRLQFETLKSATPAHIQQLIDNSALNMLPIARGGASPPAIERVSYSLSDLDGDGKVEIIVADNSGKQTRTLRWLVLQAHNGQFREIARYQQRLPEAVSLERNTLETQHGMALGVYRSSSLMGLFGSTPTTRTVLVGFPSGKDALNPAHWQFAYLRDTSPLWSGDYDGDGVEELITGHHLGAARYLVQFRDGVWRGVKLGEGEISAVLPVRLKGTPWLVLLSYEGQVKVIRIRPAAASPSSGE